MIFDTELQDRISAFIKAETAQTPGKAPGGFSGARCRVRSWNS
jgi:hypothetical protein